MWRFLWLLLMWIPVQAAALSCVPWYPEDSFNRGQSSPDDYVVVHGALEFPKSRLPQVDWSNQQDVPPETRFSATLRDPVFLAGRSKRDVTAEDMEVTVIVRCAGPWCPGIEPGGTYLSFLRKVSDGYELEFGACEVMGWYEPDEDMMKRVRKCLAGRRCVAPSD